MSDWIQHPCEPRKLILAWQPSDLEGDRFRWAVGVIERSPDGYRLRYLKDEGEFATYNDGRVPSALEALGYRGYPAFKLKQDVHTRDVLGPFLRRLPPRHRVDFREYREQFRLPDSLSVSDFALLGRTEAKLPSDGFSVVDPLDPDLEWCDLFLEVAGYRHHAHELQQPLREGDVATLEHEPSNPKDPSAVLVSVAGQGIGYINRLQCRTFVDWLTHRHVHAHVARLNGKPQRPRAFIFVRVTPRVERAAA